MVHWSFISFKCGKLTRRGHIESVEVQTWDSLGVRTGTRALVHLLAFMVQVMGAFNWLRNLRFNFPALFMICTFLGLSFGFRWQTEHIENKHWIHEREKAPAGRQESKVHVPNIYV